MGSPGNPSNPSNNPDIRIRSSVWCGVVQLDAMGALFILTGIPLCYHSNRPLTCISTGSYWPGPIIACFTQHHGIDCDSINDSCTVPSYASGWHAMNNRIYGDTSCKP